MAVGVEGLVEGAQQLLAQGLRLALVGQAGGQHHEFVAAQARNGVAGADAGAQPVGGLEQDPITGRMAREFVDPFEIVQVDEDHAQAFPIVLGALHGLVEPVHQQAPVGQAGEGVVIGQVADALRAADPLRDIHRDAVVAEKADRKSVV